MMKKLARAAAPLLTATALLLGGCQANTSGTDEKGFGAHLTVDLQIPEKLQIGKENSFSVVVEENGKPYNGFYKSSFMIWPEDGSSHAVSAEAVQSAPGIYTIKQPLEKEGVYRIKFSGISTEYEIMPAKRFAIGSKAIEHLAELEKQKDAAPAAAPAGHHH
ncbi:FixH family protein [Paenibacillus pasadenensis]|uniref:FixH family protein n=1 Tax=Paenibacillus pasadenensis TaxID=217090 RepID=UPI00203FE770|nr:FixH family protein [Paenibacillus pasadenensis]MCM3747974.1 FixH family protein [Paenibacillus pasadenensis]